MLYAEPLAIGLIEPATLLFYLLPAPTPYVFHHRRKSRWQETERNAFHPPTWVGYMADPCESHKVLLCAEQHQMRPFVIRTCIFVIFANLKNG